VARSAVAEGLEELGVQARDFRYPAVLKLISPDIIHKTEAGGVALDLRSADEVVEAARKMLEGRRPAKGRVELLLQEYVRGGREVIVGMTNDASMGPLVMFGLGGIYVETLGDVTFRIPPLTDREAAEMIREIRGYRLLEGVRGEPPIDFKALAGVLERFSQLVRDFPSIAEIEINPLLVFPDADDFRAVDARLRLMTDGDGAGS
jgi:acyl-CoA synthetase (NDP forming)